MNARDCFPFACIPAVSAALHLTGCLAEAVVNVLTSGLNMATLKATERGSVLRERISSRIDHETSIVGHYVQEERAAREAAEARAESARAEGEAEVASVRESLGAESAQAAAAREALEKDLEELKVALAQARTATDALRAQLTAEKIQAQQRIASFEKTKQEMEVRADPQSAAVPCETTPRSSPSKQCDCSSARNSCGAAEG